MCSISVDRCHPGPRARTVFSSAQKPQPGELLPRNALPHGRKIRVAILLFRFAQNRRVKCGNGEENSRPAAFHQFDHAIHFCAFWIQDRACTGGQREIHPVSQAIGKKQFRDGKRYVLLAKIEHAAREPRFVASMSAWRCTAAFGAPPLPEV